MKIVNKGFTLIELMIVIAIIGILAAIALPMYNDYIDTTNMTKLEYNFSLAVRTVESDIQNHQAKRALGIDESKLEFRPTTSYFVGRLNAFGGTAPGGGDAFVPSGGDNEPNSAQIGIHAEGTWDAQNIVVTITRSEYIDLSGDIKEVYGPGNGPSLEASP